MSVFLCSENRMFCVPSPANNAFKSEASLSGKDAVVLLHLCRDVQPWLQTAPRIDHESEIGALTAIFVHLKDKLVVSSD